MLDGILIDMGWKTSTGRWDKKEIIVDVGVLVFMVAILIGIYLIKD